jgi:hypothetical protein
VCILPRRYVDFLRRVSPDSQHEFAKQLQRFTVGARNGQKQHQS